METKKITAEYCCQFNVDDVGSTINARNVFSEYFLTIMEYLSEHTWSAKTLQLCMKILQHAIFANKYNIYPTYPEGKWQQNNLHKESKPPWVSNIPINSEIHMTKFGYIFVLK